MSDLPKLLTIAFFLAFLMTLLQNPVDADSIWDWCLPDTSSDSGGQCREETLSG
jgi:hypothetical protein